jgi:hypothetical protein
LKTFSIKSAWTQTWEAQAVAKVRASWSKPVGIPKLIGRKHVDWSIFESGTTIPKEFHDDFAAANGNNLPGPGESRDVTLVVQGKEYPASLYSNGRKDGAVDRLQLRYDPAKDLKDVLRSHLKASYDYIKYERETRDEWGFRRQTAYSLLLECIPVGEENALTWPDVLDLIIQAGGSEAWRSNTTLGVAAADIQGDCVGYKYPDRARNLLIQNWQSKSQAGVKIFFRPEDVIKARKIWADRVAVKGPTSDRDGKKVFIKTDPARAEYLDFFETGTPYRYRVEIVTAANTVPTFDQVWSDLQEIIGDGITIMTLSHKVENQLRWKGDAGIEVAAKKSDVLPPSMFKEAWEALATQGLIRSDDFPGTARYRSAAISAILALLPYIEYVTSPKVTLFYTGRPFQREEIARLLDAPASGTVCWSGNSDSPKAAGVAADDGRWEDEALYLTVGDNKAAEVLKTNRDTHFPLYLFDRSGEGTYSYIGRYQVDQVAEEGGAYTYRLKPTGEVKEEPRNWIFQGSPTTFNTTAAIKALPELDWLVKRYRDQVHPGDRVFLWESGPNAGVLAIATVLTEPAIKATLEEEKPFWVGGEEEVEPKPRVSLRIDKVLDPRLPRQRLAEHDLLKHNAIITLRTGTNFALTPEEAETLMAMIEERVEPILDLSAVVTEFGDALAASHIHFGQKHEERVRAFIAALATKRLAILTGLSGSGKTQIALRFGNWLGEGRSALIPVRPDWTGPEPLFGYEDALQKRHPEDGRPAWNVPPVLAFMLKAAKDPSNPYLLILDEMNLAHVERYFADVLSGMESEAGILPNLREEGGTWRPVPGETDKLLFPSNLFIVGTVNVDETTYMFSPKVLDRANTFEFRVEPGDLNPDLQKPVKCAPGDPRLVRGFLVIAQDNQWQQAHPSSDLNTYTDHLAAIHRLLYEGGFEFGHRVFYEAIRFAAMLEAAGSQEMLHALDLQVLQKVLPRLHGTRRSLEAPLCALAKFCYNLQYEEGSVETGKASEFNPLAKLEQEPRLPRSFEKAKRMTRSLRANGFVSFTQ